MPTIKLVDCEACGQPVSQNAKRCPACGEPTRHRPTIAGALTFVLIAAVIGLILTVAITSGG